MAKTQNMPPVGPRKDARTRAAEAYRLRCMNRTWDEIATALGYGSPSSAFKASNGHIKRMPAEDQDLARAYSAGTYKQVIAQLYEVAARAKKLDKLTNAVQALEAIANTQDKHDRLEGLQIAVPTKVDIQVTSRVAVLDRAEEQLMAIAQRRPNVIDAEVIP